MKVQHLVTSLLILLLPLCLSAQGDAITSGEALIKRTVADTKAEQLVPSMTWWVTLGMVDSIKATTFANFFNPLCDPYPKTIVSTNPGALIAYDQLNIFTYLQDLASINRYLSYGVSPSSDTPTTDLRLDISSSEAVRNKEKETPSANPTWSQTSRVSKKEEVDKKAKLESEKALEMRRQSEASRITQATSNAVYPFVRTYLYMENGLLKNPQYIRLPKNKKKELKVLDTRYEAQSRTYRRLVQMYTTTVLNPEYNNCKPNTVPSLHLSFAKTNLERTLHFSHQEYLNRIDRTVEGLLVIKRLRSPFGKRSGKMTKKEMDEILPKLKRTTLPSSVQQRLADLAKEINTTVGPLRNQYNSLRNQYASSTNGLKPIESEFFQWMLGKPKYVIESLEALGTYAKRIADLPNSKTNYNQLLVITELIRISKIRLSHITFEELKAQDNLLKRATQAHYNDLQSMLQELEWSDIRHK